MQATHNILSLDVGERRVGVAIANAFARLPRSLATLENNGSMMPEIKNIIDKEDISVVVVGLPRGLNGQETEQTKLTKKFAESLEHELRLPIYFQDEALTSVKAETELKRLGKPYDKASVDALAAIYILEDFLSSPEAKAAIHV